MYYNKPGAASAGKERLYTTGMFPAGGDSLEDSLDSRSLDRTTGHVSVLKVSPAVERRPALITKVAHAL